jgi:hypothetical protein
MRDLTMVRTEKRNMKKTILILTALASLTIVTHVQAFTTSITGAYGWDYKEHNFWCIAYRWHAWRDGMYCAGSYNPYGLTYSTIYHADGSIDLMDDRDRFWRLSERNTWEPMYHNSFGFFHRLVISPVEIETFIRHMSFT